MGWNRGEPESAGDVERSIFSGRNEFGSVWLFVSMEGAFPYTQLQLAP